MAVVVVVVVPPEAVDVVPFTDGKLSHRPMAKADEERRNMRGRRRGGRAGKHGTADSAHPDGSEFQGAGARRRVRGLTRKCRR